jgi:hypothetical protein
MNWLAMRLDMRDADRNAKHYESLWSAGDATA